MSKQAFSVAEEEPQAGRELVPAGDMPGEVPAHAKARPIPRISIQAFCEDAATAEVVQAAATDRRLAKSHVSVHMGGATGRRGALPREPDAQSDHHRDQPAARADAGRARPARAMLRCRHQGGRDRPHQRRHALSRAAEAGRERIPDRADHASAADRKPVQSLQQPRNRSRRQRHRFHRRQGRRRLEHRVSQRRLGHVGDPQVQRHHRRPRSRLRHHRPRFQSGSRAGHRRGPAEVRSGSTRCCSTAC